MVVKSGLHGGEHVAIAEPENSILATVWENAFMKGNSSRLR